MNCDANENDRISGKNQTTKMCPFIGWRVFFSLVIWTMIMWKLRLKRMQRWKKSNSIAISFRIRWNSCSLWSSPFYISHYVWLFSRAILLNNKIIRFDEFWNICIEFPLHSVFRNLKQIDWFFIKLSHVPNYCCSIGICYLWWSEENYSFL